MRPTHLKPTLDAEFAAYLARGGIISTPAKRPDAVPYMGTDKQATTVLRCAKQFAGLFRMSADKFEIMATETGFPQCYLHAGERKWYLAEVQSWRKRRMA